MRTVEKMTMLALGIFSFTAMAGCSDNGGGAKTTSPESHESTGTVDLALQLGDGRTINTAGYVITGPNGFSKSGTITLSSSTKLTALIGGLPAGAGYQITLSASTTDSSASCAGSASFSVQAGKTISVSVPLTCHETSRLGSVMVAGKLNLCPTIDVIGANPGEVQVGGSIALTASAHDSDAAPNPLSFAWTVSAGATLSSATAQNPTLNCTAPGTVTLTLTVGDGDPLASCADTRTAEVTCSPVGKTPGTYQAGDVHNHTTCSDGSISMQKLVKKATDRVDTPWGLDWFVQAGHGGNGFRNCTLVEDATLSTPAYPFVAGVGPNTSWESSGVTPKGDANGTSPNKNMWRWQSVQEFQYPLIEYLNAYKNLPLFLGVESVVAGHEHSSMSVINGQIPAALDTATLPTTAGYTAIGNGTALAQWEYCFDRADTDTSRGAPNNAWDCSVTGSLNAADPSWNATGKKLVPAGGVGNGTKGHNKTLEALKWMTQNAPNGAYYLPTHLERAGQFNPDGNNGYNVEHLRNFNNTAPRIAFGMETQPGHGASANRGEYQVGRQVINGVVTDSVGGTTFGGTGVYGGQVGGVWDAMLGEGRNFWFFASSDWHNRGSFGPDDRRSTQDFFPGEYQRNYTMVRNGASKARPQTIVDGMRTGNNFTSSGQIIDRLAFVACTGRADALVGELATNAAVNNISPDSDGCATMGEKLKVAAGSDIVVAVSVRDPAGTNYSPYTFPNPSLAQININQPINAPVLDHVDLIGGLVTGYRTPGTAGYAGAWPANTDWLRADGTTPPDLSGVPDAAKNLSAAVLRTFNGSGASAWQATISPIDGSTFLTMTFHISAVASQYVRLRGTNMPPAVPFETDASGNPLADVYTNANDTTRLRIPCTVTPSAPTSFDGCPGHLAMATGAGNPIAGQKAVSFDVAAWADLWFYANPIYIEVAGSTPVAGVQ